MTFDSHFTTIEAHCTTIIHDTVHLSFWGVCRVWEECGRSVGVQCVCAHVCMHACACMRMLQRSVGFREDVVV